MKLVRVGVCLLVAYAVLAFGGVDSLSEAVLEIGAMGLLLIWTLRSVGEHRIEIRWNWLYLPVLGLCGVGIGQYALSLTAYPYSTKVELLKLGMYLFLGFLAVESIRTEKDQKGVAWFLAGLSFAVSLVGILQFFSWNGRIFWLGKVVSAGTPFGPFVDRDHFAGFVELTVPFAFALLLSRAARREMLLLGLFGIVPVGAVVLSGSRGGILSLIFEAGLMGILSRRQITRSGKGRSAVVLLVLCGMFTAWLGMEGAYGRFKDLISYGVTGDRRMSLYKDTWRIFADHHWMGTGLGTLQSVYPRYESRYDGYIVDHAHNDYLELLADTGIAGGLCGIAFIVVLFGQGFANLRKATTPFGVAFHSAALTACSGLLLHSAVDFNLHIPSNALLFLLIAFTGSSLVPERRAERETLRHSMDRSSRLQCRWSD